MDHFDVVVVGSGNAGFCAAHAARESGASAVLLEKAPAEWIGGNSYYTAGAFRIAFDSRDEIARLVDDVDLAENEIPPYPVDDFLADIKRLSFGRSDEMLAEMVATGSLSTLQWLRDKGMRFKLLHDRQSFLLDDGRRQFWGGLVIGTENGGKGLIEMHQEIVHQGDVPILVEHEVTDVIRSESGIVGVICRTLEGEVTVGASSVVLASGGFEADPRLRATFLGSGWDLAKVRGTPFNTGDGIAIGLKNGAQPAGHWSGCHAVAWDADAPDFGDREETHSFTRQGYPFGIVVNSRGDRFVDEGADFRNYTYARYGAEILRQPGGVAWQVFDALGIEHVNQQERTSIQAAKITRSSLEELALAAGLSDPGRFCRTVEEFNASIGENRPFNPTVKDGRSTFGIEPPKSNWATAIERPPYTAFKVVCGITFTYGGLRVNARAAVLDGRDRPIPGLFAAGELVGGIFFHNYPGGSGLMSGAVLGRIAGVAAAEQAGR